jgi:threonylcarbamoyladenosine tRNA methylthiotransferase MtaB
VIRERARRLREAGDAALARALARRIGCEAHVLVERDGAGRTEHYAPVRLTSPAVDGTVVRARLSHVEGHHLIGVPL